MGNLVSLALPLLEAVVGYVSSRKSDIARDTGLSEDTVGQVSDSVTGYLSQDERALAAVMAEIDKAREHDSSLNTPNLPVFVAATRAMVRPVITLVAFLWFVYARCAGIELSAEDYTIVGGVMAFWFGLRPFEKHAVTKVTPQIGKGATVGR